MSPLSERIEKIINDPDLLLEIEELEDDAANAAMYKAALHNAVDKLAEVGVIDPTPHSKYLYRTAQRMC